MSFLKNTADVTVRGPNQDNSRIIEVLEARLRELEIEVASHEEERASLKAMLFAAEKKYTELQERYNRLLLSYS